MKTAAMYRDLDLDKIIRDARGRVFLSTPSSAVAQIKSAISASAKYEKKIVPVGQCIMNGVNEVLRLRTHAAHGAAVSSISQMSKFPPAKVVVLTAGSQGKDTSALARIANGAHTDMSNDTIVVVTALTPNTLGPVEAIANKLTKLNVTVAIYHSLPISPSSSKAQEQQTSIPKQKKTLASSLPSGSKKKARKRQTKAHRRKKAHVSTAPSESKKRGSSPTSKRKTPTESRKAEATIPDSPTQRPGYKTLHDPRKPRSWTG